MKPGIAVLLVFVTLGIYQYVFWWRASREVDAYDSTPGRANRPVRIGILLIIMGMLIAIGMVTAVTVPAAVIASQEPGAPPLDQQALTERTVRHPISILGMATMLVGTAFLYGGMVRAWLAVRAAQLRAHRPDVLNLTLLLGVLMASVALQFIGLFKPLGAWGLLNLVGVLIAVYLTQKHLNAIWTSSAPALKMSAV